MRVINTYREPVPPAHVLTEQEILSLCCKVVPVDDCSEVDRVGVYDGADEKHRNFDEEEALAKARAAYPRARVLGVKTEGIGPPPGTPCGKLYESWTGRNNCCDGVPALAWNMEITPDVLPHGGSIIIAWNGSDSRQVEVNTSSNATFFSDGRKTAVGYGSSIELKAGETFCGSTSVSVRDGCSEATIEIRSDLGQWIALGPVCALPGSNSHHATDVSGEMREAVVGRFKQTEVLERHYWCYEHLKCPVENGDPPALCIPDCQGSVCTALGTIRDPGAMMDTCMAYRSADVLGVSAFCHMSDGSSAVVHPSYSTSYSCNGGDGAGSGATQLICGLYHTTNSLEAWQWTC